MALIWERIDRVVVNDRWLDIFPEATVTHLIKEESDHCPIMLAT